MDFKTVLRNLQLFVYIALCVCEQDISNDWLHRATRSAARDRQRRTHRKTDTSSIVHANRRGQKTCCQNGGVCIMGSFCHCPEGYYGRYCEHEVKRRDCGTLKHGTWLSAACNLCHCFDGNIICKEHHFKNCKTAPFMKGVEESPDYHGGVENRNPVNNEPLEYEQFYDGYEEDYYNSSVTANYSLTLFLVSLAAASLAIGVYS